MPIECNAEKLARIIEEAAKQEGADIGRRLLKLFRAEFPDVGFWCDPGCEGEGPLRVKVLNGNTAYWSDQKRITE